MRQDNYEIIVACIQHGAPALANKLITAFNNTVEAENQLIEIRRIEAENARKAELEVHKAKLEAEAKAEEKPVTRKKLEAKPKAEQMSLPLDE